MAGSREKIEGELAELLARGLVLWLYNTGEELDDEKTAELEAAMLKNLGLPPPNGRSRFSTGGFDSEYQVWYTQSLRIVEQLMPDRYQEFRDLYRLDRRKEIDAETYCISDFIAGITVSRLGTPVFDIRSVAMNKFKRQIDLVLSAYTRISSSLVSIAGTIEADLFDSELLAARGLLKANHLRGAGVVAGVVLEGHLQRLILDHSVPFRKTKTLANLNQALKDATVYDTAEWRKISYLTDLRNECGHKTDTEPTSQRVQDLIDGVDRVIKTVS